MTFKDLQQYHFFQIIEGIKEDIVWQKISDTEAIIVIRANASDIYLSQHKIYDSREIIEIDVKDLAFDNCKPMISDNIEQLQL